MTPFAIALAIIVGVFLLESIATVLNSRSTAPRPPKGFENVYDLDRYARSQEYKRTNSEFGLFQNILSLAALLSFWLLGGFGWLHEWSQTWQMNEILRGVCVIGLVGAASSLLSLPFSIYDTFVIEERFGFNKTTPRTFITDHPMWLAEVTDDYAIVLPDEDLASVRDLASVFQTPHIVVIDRHGRYPEALLADEARSCLAADPTLLETPGSDVWLFELAPDCQIP